MKISYLLDKLVIMEREAGGPHIVAVLLKYVLGETEKSNMAKLVESVQNRFSEKTRQEVMTGAQWLRQEGFKEGRQEGTEERSREIALSMLKKGIDIKLIEEITGLSEDLIIAISAA